MKSFLPFAVFVAAQISCGNTESLPNNVGDLSTTSASPTEETIEVENCQLDLTGQKLLTHSLNGVWMWQKEDSPETFVILRIAKLAASNSFFVSQQFSYAKYPKYNFCRKAFVSGNDSFPSLTFSPNPNESTIAGSTSCFSNISVFLDGEDQLRGSLSLCGSLDAAGVFEKKASY